MCKTSRSVAIDVEYLDPVWVTVEEAEDQGSTCMLSQRLQNFLISACANEALSCEIRVAFALGGVREFLARETVNFIQ